MDEEKTLDEYYEELCEHYQENDNDVVEFLCNEEVPRGLTYEDVLQLYTNLLHDTSDVDLFMVCDSDDEHVWIKNIYDDNHRVVPTDNIYPNRLKGEEWDNLK